MVTDVVVNVVVIIIIIIIIIIVFVVVIVVGAIGVRVVKVGATCGSPVLHGIEARNRRGRPLLFYTTSA